MVSRSGRPSHWRRVRLVSVGHNVFFLMVFPVLKVLSCHIPVEAIIKFTTKIFTVICLKIDVLDWIFQCLFPILPVFCVSSHLIGRRQLYAAENDLTGVPSLRIKHAECVVLILHAQVNHLWIDDPDDAFVERSWVEPIVRG